MPQVKIDDVVYETTIRNGAPAIRSLTSEGKTSKWFGLSSSEAQAVMTALDIEPAFAPGFVKRGTQQ